MFSAACCNIIMFRRSFILCFGYCCGYAALVLLWFAIENKILHGQDFCNKLRTSWSVRLQYSRSFCVYNQIKSKLYTQKLLEYCNVTDQLVRSLLQKSWPCRILFSIANQSKTSGSLHSIHVLLAFAALP